MNRKKLEKLISQNEFEFKLDLFSDEGTVVDLALKTGENSATIEALEESHEETVEKVERLEDRSRWNDESIDYLREEVYKLKDQINELEIKEEIEEENEPGIHEEQKGDDETETVVEQVEEEVGVEKKSNLALIIGTLIFGAVSVFLIKLYENRGGADKE